MDDDDDGNNNNNNNNNNKCDVWAYHGSNCESYSHVGWDVLFSIYVSDTPAACTLITVPGGSSETSLRIYQPTRLHLSEGSDIHYLNVSIWLFPIRQRFILINIISIAVSIFSLGSAAGCLLCNPILWNLKCLKSIPASCMNWADRGIKVPPS
jgi:hypothetical protein